MSGKADTEHPPDLGDAYRILRVLGRGGMGTVYLAHDVKHDRQVAIKTIRRTLINEEVLLRFHREIKLTAQLQHPRILPLLDSGVADGTLYYVMQYIEGESLEERIAREGQLPFDDALRITRQVADALAYAHSRDIIHRDIKPANIMLQGGHALVMDFGIARALSPDADDLTRAGTPIGTPAYMSPEQISDATVVDGRADIYSLGCVLYEMLAGQPPFTGRSVDSILRQQVAAPPTQIDVHRATVPEPVQGILSRALAKASADRYRSAADLVSEIEALAGGNTLGATAGASAGASDGQSLIDRLKERRLVQFVTGYAAGGWIVLEVIDQLAGNDILPGFLYQVALVLLLCGLPGVFIVAWFHGQKGDQRAPALERWLLAAVGLVALVAGGLTVRSGLASDGPAPAALEALAPTEDPRRVAVTYFDAREESEFLAAGLTEALIDELSSVKALHVVSRNGVAQFRGGPPVPADSVGRALGVGTVVEGRLLESDSVIRLAVALVRATDGSTVGSRRLEAPRSDLFRLQDTLAAEVALFLRDAIGEEIQLIERQAGTANVEAWEVVQRAEALREESTRLAALEDVEGAAERLLRADSLLARAEDLSPDWSEPSMLRGWVAYERARLGGFDRSENAEWLARGLEHAARALAIDSQNADALELRGTIQYWKYLINLTDRPGEAQELFAGAERDLRAAVRADPEQASALSSLAHLLLNKGATAQAKLAAEQSYRADPYLRNANLTVWRLFSASMDMADDVEARKWCEEGRRRFPEDFRFRQCQVVLYSLPGQTPDIERAWETCDEWTELSPAGAREYYRKYCEMLVGTALVRAGREDSARNVLERARAGPEVDPMRDLALYEAIPRSWLGDLDVAFDLLATYLAANPAQMATFGADESWWFRMLRADPRWEELFGAE